MTEPLTNIAVVGAGRMGRGIAVSFAWAGYPVALVDSEERAPEAFAELAAATRGELLAECHSLASAGIVSPTVADEIAARVDVVARAESHDCLQAAQVVFEAVAEVLEIKQSTYAWLSNAVSETAILASTTSTMLADTLAGFVTHAGRFTNAHWLNPAFLMPLVEISPAGVTRPDVVVQLRALLEDIGKVTVECRASPGYIVSRIQALVLNEAARLVEEGVASADDVDRAIRTGFGPRYTVFGPLEFIDWGGGDILYYASSYLADSIDEARFAPADIVRRNMEEGRNGMREGEGFYDWRTRDLNAYRAERLTAFAQLLGHLDLLPDKVDIADGD
jgi:3-hydroxybutyryl-CoA dehydrogenase